jgi:hypothetical protein
MQNRGLLLVALTLAVAVFFSLILAKAAVAGEKAQVKEEAIEGKVVQNENGLIVLKTTWRSYMISGIDLSRVLGSKVKVTGTVSKGEKGLVINVTKYEKLK